MLGVRRVWDTESLECVKVLEGHNEAVLALAVGPSFLVSGSYDTTVRFWALDSLRCVRCAQNLLIFFLFLYSFFAESSWA